MCAFALHRDTVLRAGAQRAQLSARGFSDGLSEQLQRLVARASPVLPHAASSAGKATTAFSPAADSLASHLLKSVPMNHCRPLAAIQRHMCGFQAIVWQLQAVMTLVYGDEPSRADSVSAGRPHDALLSAMASALEATAAVLKLAPTPLRMWFEAAAGGKTGAAS